MCKKRQKSLLKRAISMSLFMRPIGVLNIHTYTHTHAHTHSLTHTHSHIGEEVAQISALLIEQQKMIQRTWCEILQKRIF